MKDRAALQHVLCSSLFSGWHLWWITKPCFILGASLGPWDIELWAIIGVHSKRVGIWTFMLSRGCFKEKGGQFVIHRRMLSLRHLSVIERLPDLPLAFCIWLEFTALIYICKTLVY